MNNEELLKKLEQIEVPEIELESHRCDLRRTLLEAHSAKKTQSGFKFFSAFSPRMKIASSFLGVALISVTLLITYQLTIAPQAENSKLVTAVLTNPEMNQALTLIDDRISDARLISVSGNLAEMKVTTVNGISFTATVDKQGTLISIGYFQPTIGWTQVFYPLLTDTTSVIPLIPQEARDSVTRIATTTEPLKGILENGGAIKYISYAYTETSRTIEYDPVLKSLIPTDNVSRIIYQLLVSQGKEKTLWFVDMSTGAVSEDLGNFNDHSGLPIRPIVPSFIPNNTSFIIIALSPDRNTDPGFWKTIDAVNPDPGFWRAPVPSWHLATPTSSPRLKLKLERAISNTKTQLLQYCQV